MSAKMAEREVCPTCNGKGRINVRTRGVIGGWKSKPCLRCSGTGKRHWPPASLYDQLPADVEPSNENCQDIP